MEPNARMTPRRTRRLGPIAALLALLALTACGIEPKPIAYGHDLCHYCSMTIVERGHAAQIVTQKGRAYSFDAVECMVNHLHGQAGQPPALTLVTDFDRPGTLIDAEGATYLIGPDIPSPMGANLTAFGTEAGARTASAAPSDLVLDWAALNDRFSKE